MQDGNNAIEAVGLTKRYDGFLLNHVSFCIPQGTVMGFTGQNGAGMRLCYREMLLAKRSFLLAFVTFLCAAALMLLVLLSFRVGNLALLPDELQEELRTLFLVPLLQLPMFFIGDAGICTCRERHNAGCMDAVAIFSDGITNQSMAVCMRKVFVLAAVCILELLCSFGYAAVCGISGMAFDAEKMAMIMVFSIITAVLAVISQFLLSRFHSKDLAGIVVMGGLLALTGGVSLILLLRDK